MKKILIIVMIVSGICLTGCPETVSPGGKDDVLVTLNFFEDDTSSDNTLYLTNRKTGTYTITISDKTITEGT